MQKKSECWTLKRKEDSQQTQQTHTHRTHPGPHYARTNTLTHAQMKEHKVLLPGTSERYLNYQVHLCPSVAYRCACLDNPRWACASSWPQVVAKYPCPTAMLDASHSREHGTFTFRYRKALSISSLFIHLSQPISTQSSRCASATTLHPSSPTHPSSLLAYS